MEVRVKELRIWGALAAMENGLEGVIPRMELGDKADDMSIVGAKLEVSIVTASRLMADEIPFPMKPADYAISFSHRVAQRRQLAELLKGGEVVNATVVDIATLYATVE